jgi:hypothetical protein
MPCDDVTEFVRLEIGSDDKLKSYRLLKKGCGIAIGDESLLLPQLAGYTIKELSAFQIDNIRHGNQTEIEQYTSRKHFSAIKAVLDTITGKEPGGVGAGCTIAEISYDGDNMIVEAEISIGIVTEKIKSCGRCDGRNERDGGCKKSAESS